VLKSARAIWLLDVCDPVASEDAESTLDMFELCQDRVQAVLESVGLKELFPSRSAEEQSRRTGANEVLQHRRQG
jgi:hypothetical protein